MVEVKASVVGALGEGIVTGELELLNEVLVGELSKAAALIGVEENVVDPKGSVGEVSASWGDGWGTGNTHGGEIVELNVDLDLVVLESNKGYVVDLRVQTLVSYPAFRHISQKKS